MYGSSLRTQVEENAVKVEVSCRRSEGVGSARANAARGKGIQHYFRGKGDGGLTDMEDGHRGMAGGLRPMMGGRGWQARYQTYVGIGIVNKGYFWVRQGRGEVKGEVEWLRLPEGVGDKGGDKENGGSCSVEGQAYPSHLKLKEDAADCHWRQPQYRHQQYLVQVKRPGRPL
jgi:hypothetical protein